MSTHASADHVTDPQTNACSCGSDHDHGPTGADIVQSLGKGFAVLSILIPVLAVMLLLMGLILTPSSPLVILLGLTLGLAHIAVVIALSAVTQKISGDLANSPTLLVARVALEEVLRLAVVLIALVMFTAEPRAALGLWVGLGAMAVWAVLTTAQVVFARKRILKPGEWSKNTVLSVLNEKISVKRAMLMRFLDVAAVLLFQVGATVLVAAAPIMTAATCVLALASGFSTLVVQRYSSQRRARSPWVWAPIGIAVLVAVLAASLVLVPTALAIH